MLTGSCRRGAGGTGTWGRGAQVRTGSWGPGPGGRGLSGLPALASDCGTWAMDANGCVARGRLRRQRVPEWSRHSAPFPEPALGLQTLGLGRGAAHPPPPPACCHCPWAGPSPAARGPSQPSTACESRTTSPSGSCVPLVGKVHERWAAHGRSGRAGELGRGDPWGVAVPPSGAERPATARHAHSQGGREQRRTATARILSHRRVTPQTAPGLPGLGDGPEPRPLALQ